jgi:hypothetical protein
MSRVLLFSLVCAVAVGVSASTAADLCDESPWGCFGALEVHSTSPSVTSALVGRFLRYTDGDVGFEIEEPGTATKRLHIFRANGVEFYSGVERSIIVSPGATRGPNPFQFIGMVFATPLKILHAAFPGGPGMVPEGTSHQIVEVGVEHKGGRVTLRTRKAGTKSLRYRITIHSEGQPEIAGRWNGDVRAPLPDDFPLTEWVHAGGTVVRDAAEARSLRPASR